MVVDSDRCSGCGRCIDLCPQGALELQTEFIDLEDKTVAAVKEEHRKKVRYTCGCCKPESGQTPCVLACPSKAISCIWASK
ncbi:MAG: 4Fe-4S binding protein [Candidatus Bathyarchaeota archaeon]|nr:4Fe-4S binding protein [Candidatus Bathyarchaeota archaeon]